MPEPDPAPPVRVAYSLLQCWHDVPGGTATSMLRLAETLEGRDDVELVPFGPRGHRIPDPPFRPSMAVRRLQLPYKVLYDTWHLLRRPALQSVTGEVDVVHATTVTVPPPGAASLVVTVHDLFPLTDPEVLTRRGVRIMSRGIDLARSAEVVCCPSEQTRSECIDHGFEPSRLVVVPHGVHPPSVSPGAVGEVLDRRGLVPGDYLLWVGTVEPRKNLTTLLGAYRRARPDVPLVLVGPEGWDEDLRDRLATGAGDVRWLGFVSGDELEVLYSGAAALCFPSIREGFGLPALEAMVHGTPVIGSAGTAIEEVVGDTGVLVDPRDVLGWSRAIADLLADPARRAELGSAAQARAAGYTWERAAELTVQAYRRALR